jgi:GxxExxY protein
MDSGEKIIYKELSYKIVGILFEVFNELGYGYQEKVYEKALEELFIKHKITYTRQAYLPVKFQGKILTKKFFDFVVDDKIVLELKKGNHFSKNNIEQVKDYLKISGLKLAIIANFTPLGIKTIRILNPDNR